MLPLVGLPDLLMLAIAIALGLVAVPMAAFGARSAVWWAHAVVSALIVATIVVTSQRSELADIIPWWRVAIVFTVGCVVSPICTGWAARWAARRWPTTRWTMVSVAALIAIALGGVVSVGVSIFLLPGIDMVNAVK